MPNADDKNFKLDDHNEQTSRRITVLMAQNKIIYTSSDSKRELSLFNEPIFSTNSPILLEEKLRFLKSPKKRN